MVNVTAIVKHLVMCGVVCGLATTAAYGQEAGASEPRDARFSLAEASSRARVDAQDVQPAQQEDSDEKGTWDNIKRGFYTGLAIGGLVGTVLVIECGHPECGPLLTFAAGVGGAIGLGIDALVDRDRAVPGVSGRAGGRRPVPSGGARALVRFRTSW